MENQQKVEKAKKSEKVTKSWEKRVNKIESEWKSEWKRGKDVKKESKKRKWV